MNKTTKNYPLSIQAAYVFVGRMSAFMLAFITPVILVRVFTRGEYGIYMQALLISMTFVEILKWGLINSLFYFYPLAKEKLSALLSQTFYALFILGILFLPIFYLLRFVIADLFNSDIFISLIWPIAIYFFFTLISLILSSLFVLEKKSKLVVFYEVANKSIRIILIVGISVIYKDIHKTIWALSAFAVLHSLVLYIYLKTNYSISIKKVDFSYFRSQVKYCFPIGAARLAGEIGRRIDKFILSALLSPSTYALYSVANMNIPAIGLLYSSIGNVAIPKMTENCYNKKLNETKELWHKMIKVYTAVTIPVVIFFFILAKPIFIILFTEKYIESVHVYRIFLLVLLSQVINPSAVLRSCKETTTIFKSHLYSMIVAVVMSFILIKSYGMLGGAVSVATSYYVRVLVQSVKVKELLKSKMSNFLPWVDLVKISAFSILLALLPLSIVQLEIGNFSKIIISGFLYFVPILFFLNYLKIFTLSKFIEFVKSTVS